MNLQPTIKVKALTANGITTVEVEPPIHVVPPTQLHTIAKALVHMADDQVGPAPHGEHDPDSRDAT